VTQLLRNTSTWLNPRSRRILCTWVLEIARRHIVGCFLGNRQEYLYLVLLVNTIYIVLMVLLTSQHERKSILCNSAYTPLDLDSSEEETRRWAAQHWISKSNPGPKKRLQVEVLTGLIKYRRILVKGTRCTVCNLPSQPDIFLSAICKSISNRDPQSITQTASNRAFGDVFSIPRLGDVAPQPRPPKLVFILNFFFVFSFQYRGRILHKLIHNYKLIHNWEYGFTQTNTYFGT
jgi:hypothetical protein